MFHLISAEMYKKTFKQLINTNYVIEILTSCNYLITARQLIAVEVSVIRVFASKL